LDVREYKKQGDKCVCLVRGIQKYNVMTIAKGSRANDKDWMANSTILAISLMKNNKL